MLRHDPSERRKRMLGRRSAIAAVLMSAAAFGGGAALAATHSTKTPALKPVKQHVSNQHLARHHCHETAAYSAADL
jgi:hypothetical protein